MAAGGAAASDKTPPAPRGPARPASAPGGGRGIRAVPPQPSLLPSLPRSQACGHFLPAHTKRPSPPPPRGPSGHGRPEGTGTEERAPLPAPRRGGSSASPARSRRPLPPVARRIEDERRPGPPFGPAAARPRRLPAAEPGQRLCGRRGAGGRRGPLAVVLIPPRPGRARPPPAARPPISPGQRLSPCPAPSRLLRLLPRARARVPPHSPAARGRPAAGLLRDAERGGGAAGGRRRAFQHTARSGGTAPPRPPPPEPPAPPRHRHRPDTGTAPGRGGARGRGRTEARRGRPAPGRAGPPCGRRVTCVQRSV